MIFQIFNSEHQHGHQSELRGEHGPMPGINPLLARLWESLGRGEESKVAAGGGDYLE